MYPPKTRSLAILFIVLTLALTACNLVGQEPEPTATPLPTLSPTSVPPTLPPTVPPVETPEPPATPTSEAITAGEMLVESVTVDKTEGRVQVIIAGNLPDACTEVIDISQSFSLNTNTFQVQLITNRPEDQVCAQVLTPFTETITLPTADLSPGDYFVMVHDQTQPFTLTAADQQPPDSTVQITPDSGPPGTIVQLMASGLPGNVTVELGAGRVNSEYSIIDTAQTAADGTLVTTVQIPDFAEVGDPWVIVVEGPGGAKTVSNEFNVTAEAALFERTNIYLIAVGDAGQSGDEIGCEDSVIPVTIEMEPTIAPLTAALQYMFALDEEFYGQSGLYNVFYQSTLNVEGINIEDGHATIALTGELLIGGVCDAPRVEAQLTYTALQYDTIDTVTITLNGQPLEEVLSPAG